MRAHPGEATTRLAPDSVGSKRRFWDFYVRASFLVLAGESILILVYLFSTSSGPHRGILKADTALFVVAAVGVIPWAGVVAGKPWRERFILAATLIVGAVLAANCVVDNGLDSPLVYLLTLPLANAALGLSLPAVWTCAGAAVIELSVVAITDPHLAETDANLPVLMALFGGMIILALVWAFNRTRYECEQAGHFAEILRLAQTDGLTGCLNHGAFFERLEAEVNRALRFSEPLGLLIADVDLFKEYNDAHGHLAGDEALAVVGSVLQHTSRSFDVGARFGGDEFAVILPATSLASVRRIAERLSGLLTRPGGLDLSVSIGDAVLDSTEPTTERLFRDADAGLYLAKAGGRGGVAAKMDFRRVRLPALESRGQGAHPLRPI
ncbi:MAG TPA: GGDEF domain-containing protein [Acidimicrobiales bacterium]|nr:GGDEF domain-containing protein [Acidimicrobiales bacterium]